MKDIYPKDIIKEDLIDKLEKILQSHTYMSFLLICSGIEFLGKCIDSTKNWKTGSSKKQFKKAILELFPSSYHKLVDSLYRELRCGLVHRLSPGSIILTQNRNDFKGELKYERHPLNAANGKAILVIEYFYFDFVEACKKVLSMSFNQRDKMNAPVLRVGPII